MYVEPMGRCNVCNEEDSAKMRDKNRKRIRKRKYDPKQYSRLSFYKTQEWKKIRNAYISKNPLCEYCERFDITTPAENVHHKIPLAQGGSNRFENLMSVCLSCHRKIEGKDV